MCLLFRVVIRVCQAFLFLFNLHTNPVLFEKRSRIPQTLEGVPGRVNSIYKGFGDDGIGSRGHPKKEGNICEGPEERKNVEL